MNVATNLKRVINSKITICAGVDVAYTGGKYGDTDYNPLWGGKKGTVVGKVTSIVSNIMPVTAKRIQLHDIVAMVHWETQINNGYSLDQLSLVGSLNDLRFCSIPYQRIATHLYRTVDNRVEVHLDTVGIPILIYPDEKARSSWITTHSTQELDKLLDINRKRGIFNL
jgi:hypothetical protein